MPKLNLLILPFVSAIALSPAEGQVALYLQPRDYLQPQYTAGPGPKANYVFVAGEPVLFNLELWNEASASVTLNTRGRQPADLIDVTLLRNEDGVKREVPVSLNSTKSLRVNGGGRSLEVPWGSVFELIPRASFVVPMEVISPATHVPGYYELRVKSVAAACEPDCQIRNHAGLFRFEIRDSSELPAQVELHTRRAWWAVMNSKFDAADAALTELLAVYPHSVFGHQLRGELAEKRNQPDVAATEYSIALAARGENGCDSQLQRTIII